MIRLATAADAEHGAELLDQLGYPTPALEVAARIERLQGPAYRILVDERDGQLLGLCSLAISSTLTRARPWARVTNVVVRDGFRGQGVGGGLVQRATELAQDAGCDLLELTTALRRTDAHAFYERLGFERTSYRYALRLDGPS